MPPKKTLKKQLEEIKALPKAPRKRVAKKKVDEPLPVEVESKQEEPKPKEKKPRARKPKIIVEPPSPKSPPNTPEQKAEEQKAEPEKRPRGRPKKITNSKKTNRKISEAITMWRQAVKDSGSYMGKIKKGSPQYEAAKKLYDERRAKLARETAQQNQIQSEVDNFEPEYEEDNNPAMDE